MRGRLPATWYPMAISEAHRAARHAPWYAEEFRTEALLALFDAERKHDPTRGTAGAFAQMRVRGRIAYAHRAAFAEKRYRPADTRDPAELVRPPVGDPRRGVRDVQALGDPLVDALAAEAAEEHANRWALVERTARELGPRYHKTLVAWIEARGFDVRAGRAIGCSRATVHRRMGMIVSEARKRYEATVDRPPTLAQDGRSAYGQGDSTSPVAISRRGGGGA